MIPWRLMTRVDDALRAAGDASPVHQVKRLTGGHVSQTMRLVTDRRRYVLKWSDKSPPGMYEMEARGLALLGQTGVRVPAVLAVSDAEEQPPRFLLKEWIDCLMPRGFEEAYHAVWPLAPGWEVRRDIFQLFWLFFFGSGWWRERRDRILRRYGGE